MVTNRELVDAAWAELLTATISPAEWQKRVQNGYKGQPYNWQNTAIGKAKLKFDQVVDCAVAPPPPPTPTVWPHGGIGIWRTGNALPPGSDRYDIVIVAGWQADKAAALPATTKALLYTSDVSCDMRQSGVDYFYGVSGPDAINNGWALKDTSGQVVHNSGYTNSILADPALPAYQDKWVSNVVGFCQAHNMDGIQIDDIDGVRSHYFTASVAKYPTDQAWQDGHAAFHAAVIPRLHAAGLWVVSNTAGPGAFLTRIAGFVDSVMLEDYRGAAAPVQAVNAGGAIAMPLAYGTPDAYRAAFKRADRGDGVFLYEPSNGGDPWGTWAA